MLALRDLECLVALSRHRHFARAAEACGLSQPAFSMRIRALEDRLATQIVKRGNRFQGLTPDGEIVVDRARAILAQVRALEEEVRAARGDVSGSLTLGVIPTAIAFAALAAHHMRESHPGVRLRIDSASSLAIQQGLDEGRFEAGLTYTEGASPDLLEVQDLYAEHYVLLVPDELAPAEAKSITWTEAAALPLILLEREMQNRRIVDAAFEEAGATPKVVAESSGFMAALAMAVDGVGATVIPHVMVDLVARIGGVSCLPLTAPRLSKSVSLVTRRQATRMPVIEALRTTIAAAVQ